MDASAAARIFHDWAAQEGLMPNGAVTAPISTSAELGMVAPVTQAGKQALRNKQVEAVAANDARSEVVVFLKRAAPISAKALAALPSKVDNVRIKYRQGVPPNIGGTPPVSFAGPPYVVRHPAGGQYYTCGSSISVGNFRDAGTLGCLVRDANGDLHGLSNNHVSGSCSYAGVGLPILAPGVLDVVPNGLAPFTLGFHASVLPLVAGSPDVVNTAHNLDAATFRIKDEALVTSYQRDVYDTPVVAGDLIGGMDVEKVGRTTGHTQGKVLGQFHGPFSVNYQAAAYNFTGGVSFDPVFVISGVTDLFSDFGDSGSLITALDAQGQRIAVGLVIAGMADGSAPGDYVTIALPIRPILAALAVTLVGGHNI